MTETLRRGPRVAGIETPISALALGTAFYRMEDQARCHAILDAFTERGGTTIDTAYGYGQSEDVIGSWLAARGSRDALVLCTKGGLGDDLLPDAGLEDAIEGELSESLRRLGVDTVDLYWLHRDNPAVPVRRILECLNGQLARGRVRALGASNWTYGRLDEAARCAREHGLTGFAAVSNNLSLAVPAAPFYPNLVTAGTEGQDWHRRTGVPLFPWSAQARGFFTARYLPTGSPEGLDGFSRRMLEVYATEDNVERLRRAERLGQERGGWSATEAALAWLLGQELPVVPIVGAHTVEEVASCVRATTLVLSADDLHWLNLKP